MAKEEKENDESGHPVGTQTGVGERRQTEEREVLI